MKKSPLFFLLLAIAILSYIWLFNRNLKAQALPSNEWQTPMEFYGKVIDENGNAIAGASVRFEWDESIRDRSIL